MSAEPDLVRDALQVLVNEDEDEAGTAGFFVAHYAAVVGLSRVEDGEAEDCVIVVRPGGQAAYITKALLREGPEVLAEEAEIEEDDMGDE